MRFYKGTEVLVTRCHGVSMQKDRCLSSWCSGSPQASSAQNSTLPQLQKEEVVHVVPSGGSWLLQHSHGITPCIGHSSRCSDQITDPCNSGLKVLIVVPVYPGGEATAAGAEAAAYMVSAVRKQRDGGCRLAFSLFHIVQDPSSGKSATSQGESSHLS